MDSVEETIRRAAPPSLGAEAEVEVGQRARELAVAMTASRVGPAKRRKLGSRGVIGGFALGIALLGGGVTAAVAGPAVLSWLGWTPDAVAQRTFEFGDGTDIGLCEVFVRVDTDYGTVPNAEADARTEDAREFLANHDWDPLIATITAGDIEDEYAIDVAQRAELEAESGTAPPPASYGGAASQIMFELISTEFEQAGYLRDGVSLEAAAGPCGQPAEGSSQ